MNQSLVTWWVDMKWLSLFTLFMLCSACAKEHGKPIANLTYLDVSGTEDGFYDLSFSSDVDLLSLFRPGEGFVGGWLKCALAGDTDFSVENVMQQSGYGPLESVESGYSGSGFPFVASLSFRETDADGASSRPLSGSEVSVLLAGKQDIPCRYVATIFGAKPYYSGTLMMPVRDILREVHR
ncbi:hypothetical protein AAFN46_10010 [Pseudomonas sp. CAU 1711]|uniref:hypothetical protein n=1 Tax=Pseudomonas sp. CAU 1711 TaxID=3140356 RepID=UPI00326116B2